ncbi:hypothetical protein [Hydrogenophaga sp. IBVHS1]|uniref:hypothetical protein n=1 Tax=unclassified Hydrogenophaga TaxID=2610897 RepID=UPI000A2E998B|nr:hypothetical protein [Hydrogenophaga sp. IBVHS1]OSZ74615.1 hypothetical protein CAP37_03900 [Hydrogenophaga sp. IBVHS1]
MNKKGMENSIRSLANLYTVVIAAALSVAVISTIDINAGLTSISGVSMLLFVAFLATLFPFFHGALRHLDDVYIENENAHVSRSALIIDFALLFMHALVFLALSQLLKKPSDFAWLLIGVLTVDVVWGLFTSFGASSGSKLSAEAKWTIINFVFIVVVLAYLVANDIYVGSMESPIRLAGLLAIAALARSVIDYLWCRDFYFPK